MPYSSHASKLILSDVTDTSPMDGAMKNLCRDDIPMLNFFGAYE